MNHAFVDPAVVTAIQDDYRCKAQAYAATRAAEDGPASHRIGWISRVRDKGLTVNVSTPTARPASQGVQPT